MGEGLRSGWGRSRIRRLYPAQGKTPSYKYHCLCKDRPAGCTTDGSYTYATHTHTRIHTHTHTHTHTCVHAHTHTRILHAHTRTLACTHTHTHSYTHTHTHTHTHLYICTLTHTPYSYTHTHTHTRTHTHSHSYTHDMHTHIFVHLHTHLRTPTHMHSYTHTHTCVHPHTRRRRLNIALLLTTTGTWSKVCCTYCICLFKICRKRTPDAIATFLHLIQPATHSHLKTSIIFWNYILIIIFLLAYLGSCDSHHEDWMVHLLLLFQCISLSTSSSAYHAICLSQSSNILVQVVVLTMPSSDLLVPVIESITLSSSDWSLCTMSLMACAALS